MIVTRPATVADVREFYPEYTCSFRAWVAEIDGEVQGIIGVALTRPFACMFSAFREALRPHLKSLSILRLIKRAEAAVRASSVPVLAIAEPTEVTAPGMLERIGFEYLDRIDGDEIYQWSSGRRALMAQALPIILAVGGSALSAGGTILGAHSEAGALKGEANQLDEQAGRTRASSQRQAIDERRQAGLVASRALSLAAASGGGADDPTVVNLIANTQGEGEYRALTALYNGNEEALGMEAQARSKRKEAKNVKTASYLKAAGSIISGGSTLADKYG
jgi:hypothetical protein